MAWRILADGVVLLHLAVIAFIVFGGALAWRWPRAALLHLPFAAWGIAIEIGQWVCPLTPLENHLRRRAGEGGYDGGFIEHYLLPVLYPDGISPATALTLAALVLVTNVVIYAPVLLQLRRRRRQGPTATARGA